MALRAAEIETLFTANVDQIGKAEKTIKQTGQRVEKNPIKVDADTTGALAGMDRVEGEAKRLVSADTVVKLDAEIGRAEANIERTKARIEELQVKADAGLDVTADTKRAEAALQKAERSLKGLVEARSKIEIDADAKGALDALAKVAAEKRTVSADVIAKVDADITAAQRNVTRIQAELEVLAAQDATPEVLVDISKASSRLDSAEKKLAGLNSARANMQVTADTSAAEEALDGVSDDAGEAGEDSGAEFGKSIIAALATIPIAGAVVGIAAAAGKALIDGFNEGLQIEVGYDRLQALTGVSEADALRLGQAAGEAYANNFGESIEANMDTTRLALQFRIIDPSATTRDAQLVVQGLSGIADVLDEDVRPVAQAVTQLLSTGMAKNATQAYDLIAAGARNGLNRNEDLIDTLTEYPALFQRLGLSGDEALGLINQGMKAGARNSDLAADALKEFQIRSSTDLANATTGFELLGMSVEDSMAKAAAGGEGAREVLAETLTRLREMPEGFDKSTAAAALFGTQAEDLGQALFAMDLSSAVDQLGGVTGAAQKMFDTLADNDASKVQQAQRNIEVAADGIKGALAAAFSEPLGDFSDWVSQNRGPVLQFFSDLINGALDFGISATESFGSFVAGPLADIVEGMKHIIKIMNPFADTSDLEGFINGMRDFESTTDGVVDKLEGMRSEFNGFADGQIALGYVNDAALRTADAVSKVGVAADGSRYSIDGLDTANLSASESGRALQEQLDAAAASLREEYDAAIAAGESQDNLKGRYDATSQALMGQLTAMGLTQEQAQALIDTVLQTPDEASTYYSSNAAAQKVSVDELNAAISATQGTRTVSFDVDASKAYEGIRKLNEQLNSVKGNKISIGVGGGVSGLYHGGIVEMMAAGGVRGTAMQPIAQRVPPNTWRIVGDRPDVAEAYIPLDGSPRSVAILMEAIRLMPGLGAMAQGGVSASVPASGFDSIVGLRIEGRIEIGADGLARLVEGRVVEMIKASLGAAKGKR